MKHLLSFAGAGSRFGFELPKAREIVTGRATYVIPNMPEYLAGVLVWKGLLVPVIDVMERLGRGPWATTNRTCIVVADVCWGRRCRPVGLLVQEICGAVYAPHATFTPAPDFGIHFDAALIRGTVTTNTGSYTFLDVDRLLSREEKSETDTVLKAAMEAIRTKRYQIVHEIRTDMPSEGPF